MKKIITTVLLATTIISIGVTATKAEDVKLQNTGIKISENEICEKGCTKTHQGEDRFFISDEILMGFKKNANIDGEKAIDSAKNWYNTNKKEYNEYMVVVNGGRYECYNMCTKHRNVNPYDYGFKDEYKAD